MNNIMKNGNKGFSLVELIVVIAIMAVMTSVLAPALLGYVERSRAQKDDSAMSEVVNAVMLAMSDQDVYDEMLFYCAKGNVSSYVDSGVAAVGTHAEVYKELDGTDGVPSTGTNGTDQYWYTADARLKDEEIYHAAGNMRGVTITFAPEKGSNGSTYDLYYGAVNSFIDDGTRAVAGSATANGTSAARTVTETPAYFTVADPRADLAAKSAAATPAVNAFGTYKYDAAQQKTVFTAGSDTAGNDYFLGAIRTSNSPNTYLYNRIRATVGDSIPLTSQTYRNSEYTIFIRMGSTGGNQASAQDSVLVYGQWNGTNLAAN